MYTINPGSFNKNIELLEYKSIVDEDNIAITEWTPILTCKSRIRSNNSNLSEVENGERFVSTKTVTIRFPKHIKDFDSEDTNRYKLKYNNRLYTLISMSDIREENKYLQMTVKVVE